MQPFHSLQKTSTEQLKEATLADLTFDYPYFVWVVKRKNKLKWFFLVLWLCFVAWLTFVHIILYIFCHSWPVNCFSCAWFTVHSSAPRCPEYQELRMLMGAGGGGRPPQSSEKPFFQNVEIRVENCYGGYLIVKEDQFWNLIYRQIKRLFAFPI